jgi:hypothetical protein
LNIAMRLQRSFGGDANRIFEAHQSHADGSFAAHGALAASAIAADGNGPRCKAVGGDCALEAFLQRVAPNHEVLVAISNINLMNWGGMLDLWIQQVQKAQVKSWMVLAIDEQLFEILRSRDVPVFLMEQEIASVQAGTGSNHAVSALKFGILAEFLKLGWSVLLSDVDIVTLSDPFKHLYRDRDIEGVASTQQLGPSSTAMPAMSALTLGKHPLPQSQRFSRSNLSGLAVNQ